MKKALPGFLIALILVFLSVGASVANVVNAASNVTIGLSSGNSSWNQNANILDVQRFMHTGPTSRSSANDSPYVMRATIDNGTTTTPTPTPTPSPAPAPTSIQKGVNYLSQYHEYYPSATTDTVLHRDFAEFKADGIRYISLSLYWYRLEGDERGDFTGSLEYGDAFLANIKRVITIANQYGIQTMVTIHTIWNDEGTWCTPAYVKDPVTNSCIELAIVRDAAMQQAFLDMFNHTVNYLKGTPGIWCWSINEPWYWPHTLSAPYDSINQKENFITLFQNMKTIIQTLDGRPFTARFVSDKISPTYAKNVFTDDWGWDPRLMSAFDFISFNAYIPEPAYQASWESILKENVMGCISRGKAVWISEFGSSQTGASGAADYQTTLDYFKTLPINGVLAWLWRSDSNIVNPELDPKNWTGC